ncbi:MAG: hypothetical protein EXS08_09235 [Planctomycetes bacterium]|nr:hypothetical protein [Planctomycetota bacterium]
MSWLGVLHPEGALVDLDSGLLDSAPAKFSDGRMIEPGIGFGSRLWPSEAQERFQLDQVENRVDVAGTFVFDTWIPNTDGRQYRGITQSQDATTTYRFFPVDQGHSIGPSWTEASLGSLATGTTVTAAPQLLQFTISEVAPHLDRLSKFNQQDADWVVGQLPENWASAEERRALASFLVNRARLTGPCITSTLKLV